MKSGLIAVTAIALLALPAASHAQRTVDLRARTAGDLAQMCAANPGDPRGDAAITFCHGFAQGVADTVLGLRRNAFCFPNPAPTRAATLAQFVDWVKSGPDRANLPAARGLATFLAQRFPCQ